MRISAKDPRLVSLIGDFIKVSNVETSFGEIVKVLFLLARCLFSCIPCN